MSFSGEALATPLQGALGHHGPSHPWTWGLPSRGAVFWQEGPTAALRADTDIRWRQGPERNGRQRSGQRVKKGRVSLSGQRQ